MAYPTIKAGEEHPSHDVREEGLYITDPICQRCGLSAVYHGEKLKLPCAPQGVIEPMEPTPFQASLDLGSAYIEMLETGVGPKPENIISRMQAEIRMLRAWSVGKSNDDINAINAMAERFVAVCAKLQPAVDAS
jgi:hypothetical protein